MSRHNKDLIPASLLAFVGLVLFARGIFLAAPFACLLGLLFIIIASFVILTLLKD